MGLANIADGDLPGVTGKPRKFIGWWTNEGATSDHFETAYFENHPAGIGKGVNM